MFHPSRFPRLYAAASLKHADHVQGRDDPPGLSAALCRGLIEAPRTPPARPRAATGFPRLYAAASLKR